MAKKKPVNKTSGDSNGSAAKNTKGKGGAKPKPQEGDSVMVPIEREFPPEQLPIFSNHFVIQHDGPEFYLMFFQTTPPLIMGDTPEERKRSIEAIKSIKSRCVARIVVSADRIPKVIQAMQENLKKYLASQGTADDTGK